MTPVEQVLENIRTVATDKHDKGDRFKQVVLHALQTYSRWPPSRSHA